MNDTVSRRTLIGALGAGTLLPALAGGRTFPAANVPSGSRALWGWVRSQLVLDPGLAWLDTAGSGPSLRAVMVRALCALARANGIFSLVDGALGPGHVDVRLADLGCGAYATAFHRWLNAARGIGTLYVRRDAQARLWPTCEPKDGATGAHARYGGSDRRLGPEIEGVAVALEFQQVVNRARIGAHIRELAAYLRQQLAPRPGLEILTPAHVAQGGFDALRVSVHPGNDFAELDRCANALRRHL